ncbi:MAG TPA: zinc ribbon domain-containing protein [Nitrososphaerales archaeon]|nr:zinc ribbon domain-containing protein [Nitrososphaerales archaeon]
MYCPKCGKQNPDEAAYCESCGTPIGAQAVAEPLANAIPSSTRLVAESVPGSHQHILSDISLMDASGSQVMLAKKPSIMHFHFEVLDSRGGKMGEVNRKTHLTHQGFEVSDSSGALLGTIGIGAHQKYGPPNAWVEDRAGNRLARFVFESSILNFGLVKADGSKVFDARMGGGSGILGDLQSIGKKRFEIDLYDPGFSQLLLIGSIAALDSGA